MLFKKLLIVPSIRFLYKCFWFCLKYKQPQNNYFKPTHPQLITRTAETQNAKTEKTPLMVLFCDYWCEVIQFHLFMPHHANKDLNTQIVQCIRHLFGGFTHPVITKTCLYNVDPHKPHFYIVKLGFTGVYIIFLISAQNTDCGYSLEPPRRGGSNEYPQSMI